MIGSVPDIVQQQVMRMLTKAGSAAVKLLDFSPLAGGCINPSGRLETSSGDFFLKWNDARRFPGMFKMEAAGLKVLYVAGALHIPEVVGWFDEDNHQGLLLELVTRGHRSAAYWQDLGHGLAALHRHSHDRFGLDHDNYIGSLPQHNTTASSWTEFFIHQRLGPQLRVAVESGRLNHDLFRQFELLYRKMLRLFPEEPPALLHGDLWSGNVIVGPAGAPCLIDPAVYYGHREAELAFTQLFGGFDDGFYEAYNESFPLTPDFDQRADIYNLYPLLVHVNLFGGGYGAQVRSILQRMI